jgi:CDGSH-type Zn-finger protein
MSKSKKDTSGPRTVTLLKGQRLMWCSCGLSDDQPYCDSAHVMTDKLPFRYYVPEEGPYKLCMCTHTKTPPFCDGTHESS